MATEHFTHYSEHCSKETVEVTPSLVTTICDPMGTDVVLGAFHKTACLLRPPPPASMYCTHPPLVQQGNTKRRGARGACRKDGRLGLGLGERGDGVWGRAGCSRQKTAGRRHQMHRSPSLPLSPNTYPLQVPFTLCHGAAFEPSRAKQAVACM